MLKCYQIKPESGFLVNKSTKTIMYVFGGKLIVFFPDPQSGSAIIFTE